MNGGFRIVYWLCNYVLCCSKMDMLCFRVMRFQEIESKKKLWRWIPGFILVATLVFFEPGDWSARALNYVAPFYALASACMYLKRKRKTPYVLALFLGLSFIEALALAIICGLLGFPIVDVAGHFDIDLLVELAFWVLIAMAAAAIEKHSGIKGKINQAPLLTILCAFCVYTFCAYSVPLVYYAEDLMGGVYRRANLALLINAGILFGMNILLYVGIQSHERLKAENDSYMVLLEQQKLYYQALLDKDEQAHKLKHDMFAHLGYIEEHLHMGEGTKALDYVQSLLSKVDATVMKYKTGNHTLDVVLNNSLRLPEGMQLKIYGALVPDLILTDMDICVLFSNLLNNAIFAAGASSKKAVTIKFEYVEAHLYCSITNTTDVKVKMVGGKPIRQQGEEGKGYGVGNVCGVIDRYQGSIAFKQVEGAFIVEFSIPNAATKP